MATKLAARSRDTVSILGIPVDRVTMDGALEIIGEFLAEDRPHVVATADSSGLYAQLEDPEFRRILLEADLVTPDSFGVVWAAGRAGKPVASRVSGVELVDRLCGLSARHGHRIYLLGAAPGVAELAAERLRLLHPGCNIVGTRHGYFPADDDPVVAAEVALAKPDVLLVALGIPRQEKFIDATREIVRAKVAIGVGGSFDVYSGRAKRAPRAVQAMRLEWLWRVVLNPRKVAKVAALPKFALRVLRSKR